MRRAAYGSNRHLCRDGDRAKLTYQSWLHCIGARAAANSVGLRSELTVERGAGKAL